LHSETVRSLQYAAETKEKRQTARGEEVSNAKRLYVVPGTGGLTKSYLVHSTCNTRTYHPSATGGSTHSTDTEQMKSGPGDVCNYLHLSLTQLNTKCLDMTKDRIPELTFIIYMESNILNVED
jgi:hypothetical protein